MKKLIALLSIIGILMVGCMENESVVNSDLSSGNEVHHFLKLPAPKDISVKKVHSSTANVTYAEGGVITINNEYIAANGNTIKVFAEIVFKERSFADASVASYDITMNVDDETTSEEFFPHMYFANYPSYNVRYEGLDLTGVNPDNVQFVYMDENGAVEIITDKPYVDIATGTLEVTNAMIPHFSRYGFIE